MKNKKILLSAISMILVVLLQLTSLPLTAFASSPDAVTFTSINFYQDTACTTPLPDKDVNRNSNVTVRFDFSISSTATSADVNTEYPFTIPKEIPVSSTLSIPVYDNSVHVADVTINPTSSSDNLAHGILKLLDAQPNGGGYFVLSSQFDLDNSENQTPVIISFTANGTTLSKEINFDQPATKIDKSGTFDASSSTITWTVHVNTNNTTVSNGVLNDELPAGLTYVDNTFTVGGTPASPSCTVGSDSSQTLSYTFADTKFSDEKTVTFKTLVSPSLYNSSVTNTAALSYDGDNNSPATAASNSVSTPVTYITKSGSYDGTTNRMKWEIDFNTSNMQLGNAVVTDLLPKGLALDSNSNISIQDTGTGSTLPVGTDSAAGYYYTCALDSSTGRYLLTYYASASISKEQMLTFSTPMPADYFQRNTAYNFTNTAKLTGDGVYPTSGVTSKSVNPTPSSSVLDKSCVSYNAATQTATWRMTVNKNKAVLNGVQLTDTIPADQDYNNDAAFYTNSNYSVKSDPQPFSVSQSGQTLTWNFGDISNTYYIQYTTRLHDNISMQNGGYSLKNSATIVGSDFSSSTVNPTYNITRNVISKNSSYNYTTREITWTIDVNNEKMILTKSGGVLIKDDLSGSGQQDFAFEDGSVKIGSNAAVSVSSIPTQANQYYYDSTNKILWINLGNLDDAAAANREKTIAFLTKLQTVPETYFANNGTKSVSNTATLQADQNSSGVIASHLQNIQNNVVSKSGTTVNGADYIDWKVVINQNQINLNDITLEDDLNSQPISLDTTSVKLYKQTLQADGSFKSGSGPNNIDITSPIVLTKDNVKYDASTKIFDFSMPGTINSPYLLVFRTYIDKSGSDKNLSVSNTISFKGTAQARTSTSSPVSVKFQWGSGAAYGFTGSAAVKKVDLVTGQPVAGAVFELLDSYGNVVKVSDATNASGETTFDQLRYDAVYTIQEKSVPLEYEMDSLPQTVTVSSAHPNAALTFSDTRKTASVYAIKTDSKGNYLPGAEFTLYDGTGAAIQTAVSDSNGSAKFTGVYFGSYTVKETKAPDKYFLNSTPQSVTVDNSNYSSPITLSFSDDKAGNITIVKADSDHPSQVLAGAVFDLYDSSNTIIKTATTDSNGIVSFGELLYGTYTVREKTAPNEYLLNTTPQTVNLNAENPTAQLSFQDARKTAVIYAVKSDSKGNHLSNAEFTLYDGTGAAIQKAVSDSNGLAKFTGVYFGSYTVKETKAPDKYLLNSTPQSVTVDNSNYASPITLSFSDDKAGVITLVKVDSDHPSQVLAGAVFDLYDSSNTIINTATTDSNGVVSCGGLPYGPYTVREKTAPNEYLLNITPQTAKLSAENLTAQLIFQDVRKTAAIQVKKTNDSGAPLSGAEFGLFDNTGKIIQTAVSGTNGIAKFGKVPFGIYTIKETGAPEHYLLNNTILHVTITESNYTGIQTFTVTDTLDSIIDKTPDNGQTAAQNTNTNTAATRDKNVENPSTGDHTINLMSWLPFIIVSLCFFGWVIFLFKKLKKE
ncbi:MAG TPA: SpaA isopeptide-forming pilin-related protein [Ruminiclostridium sp.]|nr:SpaA isopeptide-forming pilin-related protein [Ruminiclostridium sp.]